MSLMPCCSCKRMIHDGQMLDCICHCHGNTPAQKEYNKRLKDAFEPMPFDKVQELMDNFNKTKNEVERLAKIEQRLDALEKSANKCPTCHGKGVLPHE